jgi:hypothetical protein
MGTRSAQFQRTDLNTSAIAENLGVCLRWRPSPVQGVR